MNRPMIVALCAATLSAGCAAFLNQGKAREEADQEKEIAEAKQLAEQDPRAVNISSYAELVAAHARTNPKWNSTPHVAKLDQLLATAQAAAEQDYQRADLEVITGMVRQAARDVPGARVIYERILEREIDPAALDHYLELLKDHGQAAQIPEKCRKYYAADRSEEHRFNVVVGTCKEKLKTGTDDGLAWLPPADASKIRDEQMFKTAEMMDVQGGIERQQARRDGRLFTATYRGKVRIQIRSMCPQSVFLATSATARGELGEKHEIHGKSQMNAVELRVDHFLWMLSAEGRRVAVARVSTWDNGLLVNESCTDIIPMTGS